MRKWMSQICFLSAIVLMTCSVSTALGDIYQWEWIDPNDHGLGRQESVILCPDGEGRNAAPRAYGSWWNLVGSFWF